MERTMKGSNRMGKVGRERRKRANCESREMHNQTRVRGQKKREQVGKADKTKKEHVENFSIKECLVSMFDLCGWGRIY